MLILGRLVSLRCRQKYKDVSHIDLLLTFLPFLAMALIVGLRGEATGADTPSYLSDALKYRGITYKEILENYLKVMKAHKGSFGLEIGYVSIAKFLTSTFHSTQAPLLFMSFLTYFCFWIGVNYLSDDPYLSAMILLGCGFFIHSMNIARQMTAIGLMMIIYLLLLKKHQFAAFLLFIFAFFIHQTTIIGFLAIWLFTRVIPVRRSFVCMLLGLMLILVAIIQPASKLFVKIFPKYISFLDVSNLQTFGGIKLLWMVELLFALYLLIYGLRNIEHGAISMYDRHTFCSICFTFLYIPITYCSQYVWLTDRIGLYFLIGLMFLFPIALKRLREHSPKPFYLLCTIAVWGMFILWFVKSTRLPENVYSSPWIG